MKQPFDIALKPLIDNPVLVKLKNGLEVRGKLEAYDIHINLVLSNAVYKEDDIEKKFPRIFIRGDMVLFIS